MKLADALTAARSKYKYPVAGEWEGEYAFYNGRWHKTAYHKTLNNDSKQQE